MSALTSVIVNRRSSRSFSPEPVPPDVVDALVEAFRWAPSATNKQPWRLVAVTNGQGHAAFDSALIEANRAWAPCAPLKFVVLGNPDEQDGDFGQQRWLLDCGLALGQLLIQACISGLNVRPMAGFNEKKVLEGFFVPAPFRVAALVACGYPGNPEDLPEQVKAKEQRPRVRKPVEEIVYWNVFG
jgi:nitroreductase